MGFEMIYQIAASIIITALDLICFYFFIGIFGRRSKGYGISIILSVIYGIIYYALTYFFESGIFRIALVFVLYTILGQIIYEGKFRLKLILSALYWVMDNVADVIVSLGITALFREEAANLYTYSTSTLLIGAMITRLVVYVLVLLLRFIWKKYFSHESSIIVLNPQDYLILFALALVSLASLHFFILADLRATTNNIINSVFGLSILVLNVVIFGLVTLLARKNANEVENHRLAQENKHNKKYVQTITSLHTQLHKQAHEFRNQMLTSVGLIKNGSINEAIDYMQSISNEVVQNLKSIETGNIYFDILLNQKYLEARDAGIDFTLECNDCSECDILSPNDVVVLLGNTLDNAIEASRQNAQKREVHVRVHHQNAQLIYSVVNYVDENVTFDFTKKPNAGHGFGLKNVDDVLRKYNAHHTIFCEQHYVHMIVVIDI